MVVAGVMFGSCPVFKWCGRMGKVFFTMHDLGASSAWEVLSGKTSDPLAIIRLWGFWVERVAEALPALVASADLDFAEQFWGEGVIYVDEASQRSQNLCSVVGATEISVGRWSGWVSTLDLVLLILHPENFWSVERVCFVCQEGADVMA